jgi:hypothetical protein
LKLDVCNASQQWDKLFTAFMGPDDFFGDLAGTDRVWGYHQDNGFGLLNRLPCLYQVGRPRNAVNLVTPGCVTRLFQGKGNFQCYLSILFHMRYEYITHCLFFLLLCL